MTMLSSVRKVGKALRWKKGRRQADPAVTLNKAMTTGFKGGEPSDKRAGVREMRDHLQDDQPAASPQRTERTEASVAPEQRRRPVVAA